jgi:iron complex outermembrane recepter protein
MKKMLLMAALPAAVAAAWAQPVSQTVVVTGNPLRVEDATSPTSVLAGNALVLRRGSSLGETLNSLPGVSSTYFGPNASRPVIRGQDGDRIRMLSNAGASLDASSLSFDHAVPIDPLLVDRIEVLRGPAALMYGGSAIGGVVNAIDNRIPQHRLDGMAGAAEIRMGGAANERAATAWLERGFSGAGGNMVLHADAFGRRTSNLRVPAFDRPLDDGSTERRTSVVNSASEASGGALGASWLSDQVSVGLSVDSYRNDYGVVAEEDVTIRMRRDKVAWSGEFRNPGGWIRVWRAQAAGTDYQHQEVEGDGAVGTTFKTRGGDARLEAVHQRFSLGSGHFEGTVGLQHESVNFSALGEEAFVPSTRTRQNAVFLVERWTLGEKGHLSAGLRQEQLRVRSAGDADVAVLQFGPALERRFSPKSASLGGALNVAPGWQLSSGLSYTERAPTSYELYANGVHAATGAYERGNTQQAIERGRHLELALAWHSGANAVKVQVFDARFSNYIVLEATGEPDFVSDEGDAFPILAFRGSRARLRGLEIEGQWRLISGPRNLDLDAKLDLVRGTQLSSGEPLPRLAPMRIQAGLNWFDGPWTARLELQHAARQSRVPSTDSATAGWTMVNVSASRSFKWGGSEVLAYLKATNLGNTLAYSAGTLSSVRGLTPLPGRAVLAGLRVAF